MCKPCFLRHSTKNELMNCSVIDFCRQPSFLSPFTIFCWLGSQSMFALFSLVRTFPRFLIYVKPGLVGPRGTLFVSFIHLVNKKKKKLSSPSLLPEQWLRRWQPEVVSFVKTQLCVRPPGTFTIKVFIFCFTRKSHRVFFPCIVASVYWNSTTVQSMHTVRESDIWQR